MPDTEVPTPTPELLVLDVEVNPAELIANGVTYTVLVATLTTVPLDDPTAEPTRTHVVLTPGEAAEELTTQIAAVGAGIPHVADQAAAQTPDPDSEETPAA